MIEERVHFAMRTYQQRPYLALRNGYKRFLEEIHRRAGKDRNWMNIIFTQMLEMPAVYYHVFPALNQGQRDVWDNIVFEILPDGTKKSVRMIDMFPQELGFKRNESEMSITYVPNGAIYKIMGADNDEAIDRLRGGNPYGILCSEYAFMNPRVWQVLSPVLAENGGWIAFISTPNTDDDDFQKLKKIAIAHPDRWFYQTLTVEDTKRDAVGESGEAVITEAKIQEEREDGKREEDIAREYYCKPTGYLHGTIYGDLMQRAQEMNRIGSFPWDPRLAVGVCLDLGHSDAMAAWFYQRYMNKTVFINYKEWVQKDISVFARFCREETPYTFGRIILPWDGKNAEAYLSEVRFHNIHVVQRTGNVWDDLQNDCRPALATCYWNEDTCLTGLDHMRKYSAEYDDENKVFLKKPKHDNHSHGADAFRTGVKGGWDPLMFNSPWHGQTGGIKVVSDFDPRVPYGER